LTTSDILLVGEGSLVTIGNMANVDSDWLCWETNAGAAPTIVVADCAAVGSATAFGSAGTVVTCSGPVGGTTYDLVFDDHRHISIVACSGVGVATSAVETFEITLPAGPHSL
jgi:hypothetical protein